MRAVAKADVLRTVFRGLNVLVDEARFRFGEKGLHVKAVDPGNVALVIASVPADTFGNYEVEKETVVGIDVSSIYKNFIKSTGGEIEINLDGESIVFVNKDGRLKYSTSLIDPEAIRRAPKTPKFDLPAEIALDAMEFRKAIQMCEKISDDVITFSTGEGVFAIGAESDIDRCSIKHNYNGAEAKSMFSVEYMKEISKIADKGGLIIRLGTDLPVHLYFDFGEGYSIEYFVAPRIETI